MMSLILNKDNCAWPLVSCIYYEPEDDGEECVRQTLEMTGSVAMTSTVLISVAHGTLSIKGSGAVDQEGRRKEAGGLLVDRGPCG